jgi:peptidoglycan/LPS O-acetylase OafA/YrhL
VSSTILNQMDSLDPAASPALGQRLDGLTGMRALAALSVGILHSLPAWTASGKVRSVFQFGYLAVTFFFCLSGFVMLWTWTHGGRRHFYLRRFARIWPAYMFALTLTLVADVVLHAELAGYSGGGPLSFIMSAGMVQSWASSVPTIAQSWDGVLWSLSVEAFFYLLCPVILPALLRLTRRGCWVALAALIGIDYGLQISLVHSTGPTAEFFYFNPIARLPQFICGALVCRLILLGWRSPIRSVGLVFLVTVCLPLFVADAFGHLDLWLTQWELFAFPGFICVIAVGASRDLSRSPGRILTTRPMLWMGERSYEFYIMHALVLGLFVYYFFFKLGWRITTPVPGTLLLIAFLACSVVVAALVHKFIERPAQKLIRSWPSRSSIRKIAEPGTTEG